MADEDERRPGLSGGARWAIVLGAAVALVVAFAALRGGGSGDGPSGDTPAPPATRSQAATQEQATTEDEATTEERRAPSRPKVPTIRVQGGAPVGGVTKLEVAEGGRIRFRVVADTADTVHLHGYDVEKEVGPGIRATFDVDATIEGRFEVELHHSGAQIARVDVTPS